MQELGTEINMCFLLSHSFPLGLYSILKRILSPSPTRSLVNSPDTKMVLTSVLSEPFIQSAYQVPQDQRARSEFSRKGVTTVALPAKTGFSEKSNSTYCHGIPAPSIEVGKKGHRIFPPLSSFYSMSVP